MQLGNTAIEPFRMICPNCRREGKARPPHDDWGRRYLCPRCGIAWALLTPVVASPDRDSTRCTNVTAQ